MKKLVFSLIAMFCVILLVNAQENIVIHIQEVTKKDRLYIAVSITNNGEGDISLYNNADYSYNGGVYTMFPNCYMTFIGNPLATTKKESRPVVLSETIGSMGECTKRFVIIRKGETLTDEVLLFGPTPSPYVAFNASNSSLINQVSVQLTLNYYDVAEGKNKKSVVLSEILDLSF